jgi:glycosidase
MIHGDYLSYVRESGIDSVTQYELWKATWSALKDVNLHELSWTLGRHAELVDEFVPMTFLSNHDVTRVASQVSDARHHAHAVVLLGFLPGIPSIYYGDELGMQGVKEDRFRGDDAIRPEFPADRGDLLAADPALFDVYARAVGLRRRNPWLVDAKIRVGDVTNKEMVVTATPRHGDQRPLRLALNLSDQPMVLPDHREVVDAGSPVRSGRVEPHSWAVVS